MPLERHSLVFRTHSSVSRADSWLFWRSPTFGSPNLGEQPKILFVAVATSDRGSHSSPKLGEVPEGRRSVSTIEKKEYEKE
ncbi:MAG: hypothetical protein J6X88_10320 [Bacteroidales bacterium]|nr:hypothetical protein [Bacteroidales bacterium]